MIIVSTNLDDHHISTYLDDYVSPHLDLKRGEDASWLPGHQWLGGGCALKPVVTHVVIVVIVIMFITIYIIIKTILMVTFAADYELSWLD